MSCDRPNGPLPVPGAPSGVEPVERLDRVSFELSLPPGRCRGTGTIGRSGDRDPAHPAQHGPPATLRTRERSHIPCCPVGASRRSSPPSSPTSSAPAIRSPTSSPSGSPRGWSWRWWGGSGSGACGGGSGSSRPSIADATAIPPRKPLPDSFPPGGPTAGRARNGALGPTRRLRASSDGPSTRFPCALSGRPSGARAGSSRPFPTPAPARTTSWSRWRRPPSAERTCTSGSGTSGCRAGGSGSPS